jgi:D-glycero-D-manno-heptose 1,7-bisphosphate phosphatase
MRPAIFLDRDGTLIRERHYLSHPEDLELFPWTADALRLLAEAGYALVLVSNQSGVARGLFGEVELLAVQERLVELLAGEGIILDALYHCPHHPDFSGPCDCRKPATGMVERAVKELGLTLADSWVVGDKADDIELARAANLRGILVRSGHGAAAEAAGAGRGAVAVVENLLAAARQIIGKGGRR